MQEAFLHIDIYIYYYFLHIDIYIYYIYIYIYLVIYITSYFVIHIHDTYRDIDIKLLRDRLHAINRKNFESFCFLKISYIMTDWFTRIIYNSR